MLFLSFLVLAQVPVARESSTIDLGDFKTKAEFTFPDAKTAKLPTVILVHGTGPSDMDASFPNLAIFKAPLAISQQMTTAPQAQPSQPFISRSSPS